MSEFLTKLQKLDKTFKYDSHDDSYVSNGYELYWLENDLYLVSEVSYNNDTGLHDFKEIDVMNEEQILKYVEANL